MTRHTAPATPAAPIPAASTPTAPVSTPATPAPAPGPDPRAGIRLLDTARSIPAAPWDALVGSADYYLSSGWLRVLEETAGATMGYLLAGPPDQPAGALPTALALPSAPWLSGRPDTLLERGVREQQPGAAELRAALPEDLTGTLLPGLVCGGRHLGRTRVLTDEGPDAAAVTDELVAAAEALAGERGARSTSFLYVDERDQELRRVLAARGYACFRSGRYCWLPLPAGGFDGYLAGFSPRHRRSILGERRRLGAAGVEVAIEPLSAGVITRMAELEAELLVKYGLAWTPEQSAAIFTRVLAEVGPAAQVSLARRDGAVLGFALLLRHRDSWFAHRAGFDYAAQGRLPVYFETLFYRPIEVAAGLGITAVHYGTGTSQAKLARGCVEAEQFAYLRTAAGPAATGPVG